MYLVTIQRSLELEAPDASSHEQWMNAFKFLITKTIVMNQVLWVRACHPGVSSASRGAR